MNNEGKLNGAKNLRGYGWRFFNLSVIERWHRREITIEKYGGRR